MTKEIEDKFFEKFKFFKPEKSVQESLMAFGFECGDGWKDLLWRLCEDIQKIVDRESLDQFEVVQVKEKFGTLRFYSHNSTEEILELIDRAEEESARTCEICGEAGSVDGSTGWWATICEKCKGDKNENA